MDRGNTMTNQNLNTRQLVIDGGLLALHVLKTMTTSHDNGQPCTLDGLVESLRIRRSDVRSVLSALHREGMLDVGRMRLTLEGFAIGRSLHQRQLTPLRLKLRPLVKTTRAA